MTERSEDDKRTNSVGGWHERIKAAQQEKTTTIQGESFRRIAYGDEFRGSAYECRDCACAVGELHVPGCAIERCPRCRQQRISCSCDVGN